ncbi:MAG: sugar ABC transporter permease, partial [Acidimicrobiales bacterium]|nr:sugar ABC transporter permease [Acidimicrobiales bacterium]
MGIIASFLLAAAIGVFSFGLSTRREGALGLALGVLGGSVILAALDFCTFASDAESTEGVLGVGLAGAFAWMFGSGTKAVLAQQSSNSGGGEIRTGTFRLGWYWPWLLLSPTLVILVFFLYLPAYQTFTLSTKLTRLGAPRQVDRCLSNFSELLVPTPAVVVLLPLGAVGLMWGIGLWHNRATPGSFAHGLTRSIRPFGIVVFLFAIYYIFEDVNGGYRQIYLNTVIVSSATVVLSMVFGLALAYLTYGYVRGITVYRTLLIWPYAISPPVAGILFFMMFNATGGVFAAVADSWFGYDFPNY